MKTKFSTVLRCAALIVAIANQILAIFADSLAFTKNLAYQIISIALTALISVYAAWKNNDFTFLAKTAGKIFSALKDGRLTADEVEELLSSAEGKNSSETEEDKKE